MLRSILTSLIVLKFLSIEFLEAKPVKENNSSSFPDNLVPLVNVLRDVGYQVYFSNPPIAGAYGATNARQKKVWVAPISVDMGIARQVLIHEAVHAAQACPNGVYKPIGWNVSLPRSVELTIKQILFSKYRRKNFAVEREAFYMQSHPQAFNEVSKELIKRCKNPSPDSL